MTNKDFALAVNQFFFYANNWSCDDITFNSLLGETTAYIPEFFLAFDKHDVEHLLGKWQYAYEHYGCRGAMMGFYGELDGNNRAKLLNWIYTNYKHNEEFGISVKTLDKLAETDKVSYSYKTENGTSVIYKASLEDEVTFNDGGETLKGVVDSLDDDGYIGVIDYSGKYHSIRNDDIISVA